MEISEEESEDGMITREEQQDERDRRLLGLGGSGSKVSAAILELVLDTNLLRLGGT